MDSQLITMSSYEPFERPRDISPVKMAKLRRYWKSLESLIPSSPSTPTGPPLFQYMSDLHLEVGQQYLDFDFECKAPNLILAGDIGRLIDSIGYLAFLKKQTARFERVFLVLGNHEFYETSFEDGVTRARELEKESCLEGKLTLLHQDTFKFKHEDGDVVILGCPLWSFITKDSVRAVASLVNDFKKIKNWSVEKHNAAHIEDLAWLRQELATIRRKKPQAKVLIVTHHAPLIDKTASPQHKDSPIKTAFATDIANDKHSWSAVKYWVFGHTHWTTQFKVKGMQVVGNQRGYVFPGSDLRIVVDSHAQQSKKHTFDAKRTIDI